MRKLFLIAIFSLCLATVALCQTLAKDNGHAYLYNNILLEYNLPIDGSVGMKEFRALVIKHCKANNYPVEYYNSATNGINNQAIVNHCYWGCDVTEEATVPALEAEDDAKAMLDVTEDWAWDTTATEETVVTLPLMGTVSVDVFNEVDTTPAMVNVITEVFVNDSLVIDSSNLVYLSPGEIVETYDRTHIIERASVPDTILLKKDVRICDCSVFDNPQDIIDYGKMMKYNFKAYKNKDKNKSEAYRLCWRQAERYARNMHKDRNRDGRVDLVKETLGKANKSTKSAKKGKRKAKPKRTKRLTGHTKGLQNSFLQKIFPYIWCNSCWPDFEVGYNWVTFYA